MANISKIIIVDEKIKNSRLKMAAVQREEKEIRGFFEKKPGKKL